MFRIADHDGPIIHDEGYYYWKTKKVNLKNTGPSKYRQNSY